ncbi:integrator complex subunit 10 [Elysia marginata]|uniref:Integrator complex subunit 10 n=1 Tax=Elysia marginata TaxID=1093978 RepID=A0AAV4J6A5_9GAST|nr:integrator complex subunit 10 [Elysia marginata]
MASVVANSELSDVDWLVMRARSFPKTDPYSAKAWLITAKSLFPQSFVIQFEFYIVEKAAKNVEEAARILQDMLQNFPNEQALWTEVQSILESLQRESQDQKYSFLTDLFAAIPTSTQCGMLAQVSKTIPDVFERCQLLLVVMRKFPNLVPEHGIKLMETLVQEEIKSGVVNNPVNCYRKLLVCDVMPLVLEKGGHLEVNMFQLYLWLQRAIEFYVSYISQPAPGSSSSGETPTTSDTEGSRPSPVKSRSLSGLSEGEMQVPDPWGNLLKLLLLTGHRLNWDIEQNILSRPKEYQIASLQHQLTRAKASNACETNMKQILHTGMVLFVYSMMHYVNHVQVDVAGANSHQSPVVLLEALSSPYTERLSPPKAKKSKLEKSAPVIVPSTAINASASILQSFEMAVKCFELLNSTEELKYEFYQLCQKWRKETHTMMSYFQADMNIYQGNYGEAITHLQALVGTASGKTAMKLNLQLASCQLCLKQYSKACQLVLEQVETILAQSGASVPLCSTAAEDSGDAEECISDSHSSLSGRRLRLMQCTGAEVLPFCLQFLTASLRTKMSTYQLTDSILAHMIILLQCDWPQQEALFNEIISTIQKQGTFTYNAFFYYVHQVDILEEFAFLDTPEGGKVNLDIMPISTKALAQQRTVTRGVNKGVKEDFKAALEKQVGRVPESSDVLIKRFLQDEREELLKSFV